MKPVYMSPGTYSAFSSLSSNNKTAFIWDYLKGFTEPKEVDDIDYANSNIASGIMDIPQSIGERAYNLYTYNNNNSLQTSQFLSSILSIQLLRNGSYDTIFDKAQIEKRDLNQELFDILFRPQIGNGEYKSGVKKIKTSQKLTDLMIEYCDIEIYLQHYSLLAKPCVAALLQMGRNISVKIGYVQNPSEVDPSGIFDSDSEYVLTRKFTVNKYSLKIDNADGSASIVINCSIAPTTKLQHKKMWSYLSYADEYLPFLDEFVQKLRLFDSTSFLSKSPKTTQFLLLLALMKYVDEQDESFVFNVDRTFIEDLFNNALETYGKVADREKNLQDSINKFQGKQLNDSLAINMSIGDIVPSLVNQFNSPAFKQFIFQMMPIFFFIIYEPDFVNSGNWKGKANVKEWWETFVTDGPSIWDKEKYKDNIWFPENYRGNTGGAYESKAENVVSSDYKKNPFYGGYTHNGQQLSIPYNACVLPTTYNPKTGEREVDGKKFLNALSNQFRTNTRKRAKLFVNVSDHPENVDEGYWKRNFNNTSSSIVNYLADAMVTDNLAMIVRRLYEFDKKLDSIETKMKFNFNGDSIKDVYQERIDNNSALLNLLGGERNVTPDKVREWLNGWLGMTPMNVIDGIMSQTAKLIADRNYNYFAESKVKTENEIQQHYHYLHVISDDLMQQNLKGLEMQTEDYTEFAKLGKILTIHTAGDLNVFDGVEFSAKVDANIVYEVNDDMMVYEHHVKEKVFGYLYRKYYENQSQPDLSVSGIRENLRVELYNEIINNEESFNYFGTQDAVNDWLDDLFRSTIIIDKIVFGIVNLRSAKTQDAKKSDSVQNTDSNVEMLLNDSAITRYMDSLSKSLIRWVNDVLYYSAKVTILGIPDLKLSSYLLIIDNNNENQTKKNVASAIYIINSIEHILDGSVYKTVIEARRIRNLNYTR